MLSYAVTFLVIALIAAVLGFSSLAGTSAWLAQVCFVLFLALALISWISHGRLPK